MQAYGSQVYVDAKPDSFSWRPASLWDLKGLNAVKISYHLISAGIEAANHVWLLSATTSFHPL